MGNVKTGGEKVEVDSCKGQISCQPWDTTLGKLKRLTQCNAQCACTTSKSKGTGSQSILFFLISQRILVSFAVQNKKLNFSSQMWQTTDWMAFKGRLEKVLYTLWEKNPLTLGCFLFRCCVGCLRCPVSVEISH